MIQCWLKTEQRSTLQAPSFPFDLRWNKSISFSYVTESSLSQSIWFSGLRIWAITDLWSIINLGYSFYPFISLLAVVICMQPLRKSTRCSWSGIQTKTGQKLLVKMKAVHKASLWENVWSDRKTPIHNIHQGSTLKRTKKVIHLGKNMKQKECKINIHKLNSDYKIWTLENNLFEK